MSWFKIAQNTYVFPDNEKIEPVKDGIFRGQRPGYPGRSAVSDEKAISYAKKMIADDNITDVFVFLGDNEIIKYYDGKLQQLYESEGLRWHHYPIEDFGVPTLDEALAFVKDLDAVIRSGGNALLHCSAGIGRTGIMLAVYAVYAGDKPNVAGETSVQRDFVKKFEEFLRGQ